MRHVRLLSAAVFSVILVAACTSADAGWTYAPAPSKAPAPSGSGTASAAPGGSGNPNGSNGLGSDKNFLIIP